MSKEYTTSSIIGRNNTERLYLTGKYMLSQSLVHIVPILRRFERFVALPYCFVKHVNWDQCSKSKLGVVTDFLYIFFVLKSFPDFYGCYRLWEVPRSEWRYYYGSTYDCYQRKYLRKKVLQKKYEVLYEDKRVCDTLCRANNLPVPELLGRVIEGSDLFAWCSIKRNGGIVGRFIAKPLDGKGGHGIYFIEISDSAIKITNSLNSELEKVNINSDYIVQRIVEQDPILSEVAKSLNTIRYVSLITVDRKLVPVGAYIRFGNGLSLTDNVSQPGGIAVSLDKKTGVANKPGLTLQGERVLAHPVSNFDFSRLSIPDWSSVVELAERTHFALDYCLLIGMDIAISKDGPVLIEVNSIYDNLGIEMTNGPLFKDKKLLTSFNEHGILTNKLQRKLARGIK